MKELSTNKFVNKLSEQINFNHQAGSLDLESFFQTWMIDFDQSNSRQRFHKLKQSQKNTWFWEEEWPEELPDCM